MYKEQALRLIADEHTRARQVLKFAPFHDYHQAHSIILEELDELWADIKGKQNPEDLQAEATQLGAMVLSFLIDLC